VTDVQPVKVAERVLTAITDPFVEWPEDDEEAAALAAARAHAEESRDQVRGKVMDAVISAMAADSCSDAAWDAVCDAFNVFLPMLFYTLHMRRLHTVVRDAALAAITAAGQPRDPAEAYTRAGAWLRPTVDRLQNSAVDLFAAMVHPAAPFVLAYQQESEPEPEPGWLAKTLKRFGAIRNGR
jgi:hypothetical protein